MGLCINFQLIIIGLLLINLYFILGCTQPITNNLFEKLTDTPCLIDEKPIIRYYSTSTCPHCLWVNPIFDSVTQEYGNKIIIRHYIIDLNLPSESEMAEFYKFSPNGNIPAFSFGCQYYRIGNSFESTKDVNAEKTEFRRVLDILIN